MKSIFDELLDHDLKIRLIGITFVLDNSKDISFCIKDLIDFDNYNDILTANYFVVRGGKLKNCEGFPKFIVSEIMFDGIFDLETMEGFPKTKYYPEVTFEYSPLPKSWKGFPSCV